MFKGYPHPHDLVGDHLRQLAALGRAVDGLRWGADACGSCISEAAVSALGDLIHDKAEEARELLENWGKEEKEAEKKKEEKEEFRQAVKIMQRHVGFPIFNLLDRLLDIANQDELGRIPPEAFKELNARMTAIHEAAIASAE